MHNVIAPQSEAHRAAAYMRAYAAQCSYNDYLGLHYILRKWRGSQVLTLCFRLIRLVQPSRVDPIVYIWPCAKIAITVPPL